MKLIPLKASLLLFSAAGMLLCSQAHGTQADDTSIVIVQNNAGPTPFISQVQLLADNPDVISRIQFTITPKEGSVTRSLSATYTSAYLIDRGDLNPDTGDIFLPVWGLYADFSNTVTLTYYFEDGSSKQAITSINTEAFDDPCGYENPIVLQPRTDTTSLSYDYMLVKGACSDFSPAIIDTDGALRWVGTATVSDYTATFFDNAIYQVGNGSLLRIDLDGTVTTLGRNADYGATYIHHNIDRGKRGVILDVDTADQLESVNVEVDPSGKLLKTWNLGEIISNAMLEGGDDPSQFVYPSPTDWFHNNGVAYNRADDSLIVSSRENFIICIDYETGAIKWILGDTTKKWYQFPSLAKYALTLPPGSLPPTGQHSPSLTYDQGLLVFDNGQNSGFQEPPGIQRAYAAPRKYQIDPATSTATEVWNYTQDESVFSPFCGSVIEDAPLNYLIDYALVGGAGADPPYAQLLALDADGEKVFYYQYETYYCNTAFYAIPLHLEDTNFPTVGPRALNLSTRGFVGTEEESLIGGFIVSGSDSHTVVLRALGPSLSSPGVTQTVADPTLTLYDASGAVIASNDDWQSDPGAASIEAEGLGPADPAESATIQTLAPGAYTFVVTGKGPNLGIGLVEAYDVSPLANSRLANLSTRGSVGTGENVLISGFIVGDVASDTVVIRAIGPSLGSLGITAPLNDPMLTVYDSNGSIIASNDNWPNDASASDIMQSGLAPTNGLEAATLLHLPAGAYTAIVTGADGGTGVGLTECFDLEASTD
jgi:arylsulfate sulfotransferase